MLAARLHLRTMVAIARVHALQGREGLGMALHTSYFSGKRRLVAIGLAVAALAGVVAAVAFMSFHTRTAYGAGNGLCSPNAPVCAENGNSAYATFDNVSSDGCIYTRAAIQPTMNLSHPDGTTSQSVLVFISKYDQCNNTQIETGNNFNPMTGNPDFTGTVQFGANMSTVSINGTAPIYDNTMGTLLFTTAINMTWQGYGPTTQNIESDHFHAPGLIMNLHITGTSRNAEASGTFSDETGTNIATGPTLNAVIFDSSGSEVSIFKS